MKTLETKIASAIQGLKNDQFEGRNYSKYNELSVQHGHLRICILIDTTLNPWGEIKSWVETGLTRPDFHSTTFNYVAEFAYKVAKTTF